jgi:hypothetical protein
MKSPQIASGRLTKATSGWFAGVNSVRNPWALPENQFKWGVNVQVRGGIVQTRPGQAMRLSLPAGNFQGGIFFAANKQKEAAKIETINGRTITTPAKIFNPEGEGVIAEELPYMVFAVGGSVYYAPFPLTQPKDWSQYRLANISLDPEVDQFVFCLATQSANLSTGKDEIVTPSNRSVFIQDGVSAPAYWDGSNKTGTQSASIPTGYWMAFSGNRLWVADKNIVLADGNTSDASADGGGITLSGATSKTFNWVDATDAWTSSEHMNLLTGKSYKINGTAISTALPALTWGDVKNGKSSLVIS